MDDREKEIEKNIREFDELRLLTELRFKRLIELAERNELSESTNNLIENQLTDQMRTWVKNLPPLPPGWVYEFIPGEPRYNPETNAWETTMEAKPRQKYIIKED